MTDPLGSNIESDIQLFDIVVKMPPNARPEDIKRLGQVSGIREDHLATLLETLRNAPQAKIGSGVPRDRANKAKTQFTAAGLIVEVTQVLSIQSKSVATVDACYFCPACRNEVVLPSSRQCPSCDVFVDKVSEDFLLKRKILEQERQRIESQVSKAGKETEKRNREMRETSFREQIRKELEEEYGLTSKAGIFSGRVGAMRGAGVVGLLVLAFAGGQLAPPLRGISSFGGTKSVTGKANQSASAASTDIDKMLDEVGQKGGVAAELADAANDADIDDPLIQAAGGKRMGAKGMTMEQAVAAAQVLGKSVGNTAGHNSPGALEHGVKVAGQTLPTASIAAITKIAFTAELVKSLAEFGQTIRAREVVKALKQSPKSAVEPGAALAIRQAELELSAWEMRAFSEGRSRTAVAGLRSEVANLADAAERSQAFSRIGSIFSRQPQLPLTTSRAFLVLADESLKTAPLGPDRSMASSNWMVGLGELALAETTALAKAGAWSKARAAGAQLEMLVKQAPDAATAARLQAVAYQVHQTLGHPDKAMQSLDAAVVIATQAGALPERSRLLRSIAQLSGSAGHETLQAAISALAAQLAPFNGLEKAQALAQLSLLFGDAGLREKSNYFSRLAQATSGLSPQDAMTINAELIVRGDLAIAKALHGAGLYAESEVVLQRLGNYLL
jgi:hypothetical protein